MILKEFTVPENAKGLRIETLIRKMVPDLDPAVLRESFSKKDVKLDGIRVRSDTVVISGQKVQIYCREQTHTDKYLDIVYEDKYILLINKRAGISVDNDLYGGRSLLSVCRDYLGKDHFLEACHRLDNQTSGLCLFAKDDKTHEILLRAFREKRVEKYYVCLVRGRMKPPSATCYAWLKKDSANRRVDILDHPVNGASRIITEYETIENGDISRLRIHLLTGKTHQIRAHLSALGHPVLGDDLYGDHAYNRESKTQHRLKLCSVSLCIDTCGEIPSLDGKRFTIEAPF